MQDTINCPICGDKMRSIRERKKFLNFVNKTSDYCERTCNGLNHSLQITVDENTKEVDLLKISLAPNYSRFIMIDFVNQICQVICLKNNQKEVIDIPKMVAPDFPDLTKLKERVSLYVTFS